MADCPIQFFHEVDMADPRARLVRRPSPPGCAPLLLSHGWLDGTLLGGTLQDVAARYVADDKSTWPCCVPQSCLAFVDRCNTEVAAQQIQ